LWGWSAATAEELPLILKIYLTVNATKLSLTAVEPDDSYGSVPDVRIRQLSTDCVEKIRRNIDPLSFEAN
jgi:hypothetical protein